MRRHLNDRQRLTFPEDSTFKILDTLPTQTSSVIFFYPFLLLISPSAVGFGALIKRSALSNTVTVMSTYPVFGNIGSCPCALATTVSPVQGSHASLSTCPPACAI
jgi:hypothetical protein